MRIAAIVMAFALAACGPQPAADAPQDASAGSTGVGDVPDQAFTFEAEALIGLWSFDRTCGLYDLVFDEQDLVQYYDYTSTPGNVISYRGSWTTTDSNRVALNVRLIDMENEPTGDPVTFNLDVGATVTDDLIGAFGPDGGLAQDITALRCPEEDRE